jgi:hypothetical protein
MLAHRYEDAKAANAEAISLDPGLLRAYEFSGLADYQLGNLAGARATCEAQPNYSGTQWCLALVYQKLGRDADAEPRWRRSRLCRAIQRARSFASGRLSGI